MRVSSVSPRILVVDDRKSNITGLQQQLEMMGLDIGIDGATTLDEARELVRQNCHHYALVGLHIERVDEPDAKDVLDEIRAVWPENLHDCFAIYTNQDIDGYASFKSAFPNRFFEKKSVEETADWLAEHVRHRQAGGYNWELDIYFDESARTIDVALVRDIEDTLRQLFTTKENLSISKLAEQGYSGAVLLQASQTSSVFQPRRFVLKFGAYKAVEQEYSNVKEWVLQSSLDCAPHMEKVAYNRARTRGAIKFHTVATAETLESKLANVVNDDDLRDCKRYLRRVISAMMRSWYSNPKWVDPPTPADVIPADFAKYASGNLAEIYKRLKVRSSTNGIVEIRLDGSVFKLRDVQVNIPPSLGSSERVPQLLVHNDFHTKNILISEMSENVYLIDFARTDKDIHAYADFAKMETHLISDLLFHRVYESNLPQYFELLRNLYSPAAFIDVDNHFNDLVSNGMLTLASRNYVEMVRETRLAWLALLDQIDRSRREGAHKQWKHYIYAMILELYQSFWWIKDTKEYSDQRRLSVLYFASMLLDINSDYSKTPSLHERP